MVATNQIVGDDASGSIQGTSQNDLIYGFDPSGSTSTASSISAIRVATGLSQPVAAVAAPNDPNHLYVVERSGVIAVLNLINGSTTTFLDISSTISINGEGGLLGVAFDPNYEESGLFYLNFTNLNGDTEIRRYMRSSDNLLRSDSNSAVTVITIDQPDAFSNHKGGWLGFGPDGYLYIPLGDGGGGGDPFGNSQNPSSLLGKILRLNVGEDAFPNDPSRNYSVPQDNPFVGEIGVSPEIWALGLRNPFRASFDKDLGTFFIGDVGQSQVEEIDIGTIGANYGWDVFEGTQTFEPNALGPGTLTSPIFSYGRNVGGTVIGGFVHRGESDALQGQLFFADFVENKLFTLRRVGNSWTATDQTSLVIPDAGSIDLPVAFGEDAAGNLYLTDLDGDIFRVMPAALSADLADLIDGGDGDDTIHGGGGADRIIGGLGNDRLYGGSGNDILQGGSGADGLFGGAGIDVADYSNSLVPIIAHFLFPDRNGGDAEGDIYTSVEGMIGSALSDVLSLGSMGGSLFALAGDDIVSGGSGADIIDLGLGADILRSSVANLAGDTISGFGPSDILEIEGAIVGRGRIDINVNNDLTSLSIGGFGFQLIGNFEQGAFMSVARGSGNTATTSVDFQPLLPFLQEGVRVSSSLINGISNEPYLIGDGIVAFSLELQSANSAFSNALGAYTLGTDGVVSNVRILFENTLNVPLDARRIELGIPDDGEKIGLFLIQNGFNIYGRMPTDLSFVAPDSGAPFDVDSGVEPLLFSATRGTLSSAPLLHTIPELNTGDAFQVLSGTIADGRALLIGFEDLIGAAADNDFQDVLVGIRTTNDEFLI